MSLFRRTKPVPPKPIRVYGPEDTVRHCAKSDTENQDICYTFPATWGSEEKLRYLLTAIALTREIINQIQDDYYGTER